MIYLSDPIKLGISLLVASIVLLLFTIVIIIAEAITYNRKNKKEDKEDVDK